MSLLKIYQWVSQWKNFENRLTFGEVIGKSLVSCFFETQCRFIITFVSMQWKVLPVLTEIGSSFCNLQTYKDIMTYTHSFNGPFSGTTQVSRYYKGKTNLDFTAARDSEWKWHQLGHMQICTSLQTDNHASTPRLSLFTGRMPFLPPNQQCQSTEGT